ncbi:MAG: hypothetical protein P4L22_02030 [Candidatus Babeliales bacterium]|nr:hypothetical protein [Candidatus Babeliales bacterium]
MLNKRLIGFIVLFCCFFVNIGAKVKERTIGEKLGKPVYSFVELTDFNKSEQFCYTTELSRILLVGEPRALEYIRCLPLINSVTNPVIGLISPLFNNRFVNNRFDNFINSADKFSQRRLQEAIEDAILLSTWNTKAYSASKLLSHLSTSLDKKIAYIKDQIQNDSKWDQKSLSSLKKSGAWATGLITFVIITNKYIDKTNIGNKVSNLEGLNAIATLSLLPVSYKILKNCYKIWTTDPNTCKTHLNKYEDLLAFVQKLKSELETNGSITFQLKNGNTATKLKDDTLIFN